MADSSSGGLAGLGRRELAAVALVAGMAVGSHVVAPAVAPAYAEYARYATYLVVFSVWMAWFVDWLAVWLGRDPHPAAEEPAEPDGGGRGER